MSTTKKLDLPTFFDEAVKCIKEGKTKAEFATYMDSIYGRGKSELGVEEYWYTKYQQGLRTPLNELLKLAERTYERDKNDANKKRLEDAQANLDATTFSLKSRKKDNNIVEHLY